MTSCTFSLKLKNIFDQLKTNTCLQRNTPLKSVVQHKAAQNDRHSWPLSRFHEENKILTRFQTTYTMAEQMDHSRRHPLQFSKVLYCPYPFLHFKITTLSKHWQLIDNKLSQLLSFVHISLNNLNIAKHKLYKKRIFMLYIHVQTLYCYNETITFSSALAMM